MSFKSVIFLLANQRSRWSEQWTDAMASSLPLLVMVLLSQEPCCLPCLAQENYNSVVLKAASEMDLHTLQDKIDATFDPGMLGMGFIKRCKDASPAQLNELLNRTKFHSNSYKYIFTELFQRHMSPVKNYSLSQIQQVLLDYPLAQSDQIVSLFRLEYLTRLRAMSQSDLEKTYRASPLDSDVARDAYNVLQTRKIELQQQPQQRTIKQLESAAASGEVTALYDLGCAYYNGEIVPQDHKKAFEWFQKAADKGNADAQFNIAVAYQNGQGRPKDANQAFFWYEKAASNGDAQSMFTLGDMYRLGRSAPQDDSKCLEYYQEAAAKGHAQAQFHLGVMYHDATNGVKQDYRKALTYYEQAAQNGDTKAQYNLALMYIKGEGIPRNYNNAVPWLEKAAAKGHVGSKEVLEQLQRR
jgi:TPR repeat protein